MQYEEYLIYLRKSRSDASLEAMGVDVLERHELQKRIKESEAHIEVLKKDLEYEKEKIANVENFIPSCKELLSCYWELSAQDRNKALKMLLESVEYTKTKRNKYGDKDNPTFTLNLKPRIPRI